MDNMHKELTLTRLLNVSRERAFEAWTDEKQVAQWWGPRGATSVVHELDVRPNGALNIVMIAGETLGDLQGKEWPMTGTFQEVTSPEKLVFTSQAIRDGKPILDNLVTVTFEEQAGKTKVTVHIVVTKTTPEATGALSGMEMGWNQQLDKLVEHFD